MVRINKTERLKVKKQRENNRSTKMPEMKNKETKNKGIKNKITNLKNTVSIFGAVVILLIMLMSGEDTIYGYSDTNLYKEKLEFDSNGNLRMTTHDKKATSAIIYRTIGWVIKRYDMPVNARGQQYAIIPVSNNVEYRDDPNNPVYMYCYYTGTKDTIEKAIDSVSLEWKNQLFKYGDYVYIDEIMTVVESGKVLGGFNTDGKSFWGEVYFDYDGISQARQWASKENLKTHYDKKVYFPSQVKEKYFRKTEMNTGEVINKKEAECKMDIGEGSKFASTYDIEKAVPTGESLYIDGKADSYFYNMVFTRNTVAFAIPIKFIITYTLKWKDYGGTLRSEKKEVIQWYYVNKSVSYYMVEDCRVNYLSGAHLTGYAFEKGEVDVPVNGLTPKMVQVHMNDYDYHIEFPKYNDVYYLDGGTLSQLEINGVKPSIPDTNRQALANSKIGNIKVRNDYLEINKICFLDNKWCINDAAQPYMGKLEDKTEVYATGYLIPHTKQNRLAQPTSGYFVYKEFGTTNNIRIAVKGIKSVSIHTPVYIDGRILNNTNNNDDKDNSLLPDKNNKDNKTNKTNNTLEVNNETGGEDDTQENIIIKGKEFEVIPVTTGEHLNYQGYGNQDYNRYIDKIEIKFDEDIEIKEADNEETKLITKGEWIEWKEGNKYVTNTDKNEINMEIRAYAKNHISVGNALNYLEERANKNIQNYVAYNSVKCKIKDKDENEDKEPTVEHRVVGTH